MAGTREKLMSCESPGKCTRSKRPLLGDNASSNPNKRRKINENSPMKYVNKELLLEDSPKIPTKSFYGRISADYLSPIERKLDKKLKEQNSQTPTIPKAVSPLSPKAVPLLNNDNKKNKNHSKKTKCARGQKSELQTALQNKASSAMVFRSEIVSETLSPGDMSADSKFSGNNFRKFFKHQPGPSQVELRKGFRVIYQQIHHLKKSNKCSKDNCSTTVMCTPPMKSENKLDMLASLSKIKSSSSNKDKINERHHKPAETTTESSITLTSNPRTAPDEMRDGSNDKTDDILACDLPGRMIDQDSPQHEEKNRLFPIFTLKVSPSSTSKKSPYVGTSKDNSSGYPQSNASAKLPAKQTKSSPKHLLRSMRSKDGKEQMILDFGQTFDKLTTCPGCGMTYTEQEPADVFLHNKFHKNVFNVLKFPGWKKERVCQENHDGSRIIVINSDDRFSLKKVEAIRKVIDDELGFVVERRKIVPGEQTYLYISEEKQVVGCCIAQVITKGYRTLSPTSSDQSSDKKPWCCSTRPEPAKCGISRIWVLASHRGKKIATKLVDCVRYHFILGYPLQKKDLAFSDPTPDGRQFVTHYMGTSSFLVYKAYGSSNLQ